MTPSVDRARALLAHRYIIFFEVWPGEGEDPGEIAGQLALLKCTTSVDESRAVVRVFAPGLKPSGLDLG